MSWIREHCGAPISWRTVRDILPSGAASSQDIEALRAEVMQAKAVVQVLRKQRVDGTWGGNILGLAPSKALGIKDTGTVVQYRRLLELGVPTDLRALRVTDRAFYRLLSRDEDPKLLFEYQKAAKGNPPLARWAREAMREGVTAALADAGQIDDPRVRGAAHRIATNVSQFLRSDLAEKPFARMGSRTVLHPEAYPPTLFSVAIFAYMPNLQRERAGFIERLGHYLSQPQPKKAYTIQAGRKVIKPVFHILGDPIKADSSGNTPDLPLALHWIELLVRLGMLERSLSAQRVLARLVRECDERGVWSPKSLRGAPKSPSKLVDFAFPLEANGESTEGRRADVTFRVALIAKLAGWDLTFA